jgi:predicted O-linked N-acetylglucosamine transferase (SPINDLY family)
LQNHDLSANSGNAEAALAEQAVKGPAQELARLRDAVWREPANPKAYHELATALGWGPGSVKVLEDGLLRCPPDARLYRALSDQHNEANRVDEALEVIRRAREFFPLDEYFRLREGLILPIMYATPEEIGPTRSRYASGLQGLTTTLRLDTAEVRRSALDAVARNSNFHLVYQGQNDRDLQRDYGEYVHRIMAANYPEWTRARAMPPPAADGRIRIGYISGFLQDHSVSKLFLGWLRGHDRSRFEVSAYHLRAPTDAVTAEVRQAVDHFHHIPKDLERTGQAILDANLHILVFLDIGMFPLMTQLAALRLAPIQCVTNGHSVTTGLPTVEYFISSGLMEPPDGQDHYTERLIRLPGFAFCYLKPSIPNPQPERPRSYFGLEDGRTVYLCCQSQFKYLPQHDDVFVQIAKRVPTAQFVFLGLHQAIAEVFWNRLERAFAAAELDAAGFCVMHRQGLSAQDYLQLNLTADVFLDALEYSGCISTMEAIACGLPVVTLPAAFMRGRQSYAILTQLGMGETIARDKQDYVEIAVRLGNDPAWRASIVERMKANHDKLYGDTQGLRALEDFYVQAVHEAAGR